MPGYVDYVVSCGGGIMFMMGYNAGVLERMIEFMIHTASDNIDYLQHLCDYASSCDGLGCLLSHF